jgi:hypothetical protein
MFKDIVFGGGRFALGLAMKKFLELGFDYALYPAALVWLGYFWGGLIMTCAAVLINILIIRAYDWAETDWLFIEKLKHVRENDNIELPRLIRWLKPLLSKGDVPAFFVLCLDDPVTATLYLRKGAYQYNGLSARDWKIFAAANVVGNLYWIIGLAGVIEGIQWVKHLLG